jgi:hypothetical protein
MRGRIPINDRHLSIRVPVEHHAQLQRIAAASDRTVSDVLREAVAIIIGTEPVEPAPAQPVKPHNPFVERHRERAQLEAARGLMSERAWARNGL